MEKRKLFTKFYWSYIPSSSTGCALVLSLVLIMVFSSIIIDMIDEPEYVKSLLSVSIFLIFFIPLLNFAKRNS